MMRNPQVTKINLFILTELEENVRMQRSTLMLQQVVTEHAFKTFRRILYKKNMINV